MPLGRGEVDEPPLGDEVDAPAVGQRELVDEGARLARLDRELAQRADLDLDVEVPRVARGSRRPSSRSMCARAITFLSPVAVQKMSPTRGRASIGSTS